jgi:hypothetical protein
LAVKLRTCSNHSLKLSLFQLEEFSLKNQHIRSHLKVLDLKPLYTANRNLQNKWWNWQNLRINPSNHLLKSHKKLIQYHLKTLNLKNRSHIKYLTLLLWILKLPHVIIRR